MLLGWVLPPSAEIYRWQDHEGVIRYSNTLPDDNSLEIEVIPTQRIPLLEDENGVVYYLHVPDGTLPQNLVTEEAHRQLNLPPEVLERLNKKSRKFVSSRQRTLAGSDGPGRSAHRS
jgi:hypothetical protein